MLPCVLFEDEHLLVVNKPAGMNTHAPAPFAGEGIYDWLKNREPRWASLAIIHRLDKETSGVMVFGKTALANRSLTEQFTARAARKKYLLLTDHEVARKDFTIKTSLVRAGERYVSRPIHPGGETAETRFRLTKSAIGNRQSAMIEAEPLTGRTHQIRVHAAENGFPILGDTLYGGTPAPRVCLHAAELMFKHPATGKELRFCSSPNFDANARLVLRSALIEPEATNAFRLIHGASDGWPGWYVDQLGDFLLSQSERPLTSKQSDFLQTLLKPAVSGEERTPDACAALRGAYHKILNRQLQRTSATDASPQLVLGEAAPERFTILENGVRFELSFNEGYSVGLFLDQRDNRRRFLTGHVAGEFPMFDSESQLSNFKPEVLNTFAYTCGFSVCAALAGAKTTSLDLSKKYLEWGRRNFELNDLDAAEHDFIYGDTFDWLRRFAKKGRQFDGVVLDPPTFSRSKEHGVFRAEKDYGKLVKAALGVLKTNGVLFASTNAATLKPEEFLETVAAAIRSVNRRILKQHFIPQPPDFPISRDEPGYLKTFWLRIG